MTFGERLVHYRNKNQLTQKKLAEILDITPTRLNYWEKDKREPDMLMVKRLAKVLGVSTDTLLDLEGDPAVVLPDHPDILPISKRRLPFLGAVACGEPIFADEDLDSYMLLNSDMDCDFALRCQGDSMINARIYDGDIVYIKKQEYVDDGTIVVALIDDEATLKRIYHLGDGRVMLQAENPRYAPIIIGGEGETRTFRVLGKAVSFQGAVV